MEGMHGMEGSMGDTIPGMMSLADFQAMPPARQSTMLFNMMQTMMQNPMMEMMRQMMPGMRDMQFMSPFFTARGGDFFWLFKGARVESGGEFAGALIGTFVFSVLATMVVEAAKRLEHQLARRPLGSKFVSAGVGGLAHATRLALHYLAMLLVMTFNVWVFLAVVAGHGVGFAVYRLFGGAHSRGVHSVDAGESRGVADGAKAVDSSTDSEPRPKDDCC